MKKCHIGPGKVLRVESHMILSEYDGKNFTVIALYFYFPFKVILVKCLTFSHRPISLVIHVHSTLFVGKSEVMNRFAVCLMGPVAYS